MTTEEISVNVIPARDGDLYGEGVKEMLKSYRLPNQTAEVKELAAKITQMLVKAEKPYQVCVDALEVAGELLAQNTRPINANTLLQSDS